LIFLIEVSTLKINYSYLLNGEIVMKIKTGSVHRESIVEKKYSNILQNATLKKCSDYSNFYFKSTAGGLFLSQQEKNQLKIRIKEEARDISKLEEDNKSSLLNYLEDLILSQGNYEFIIPYHFIAQNLEIDLNSNISRYENTHHLGVLGTVNEILSE